MKKDANLEFGCAKIAYELRTGGRRKSLRGVRHAWCYAKRDGASPNNHSISVDHSGLQPECPRLDSLKFAQFASSEPSTHAPRRGSQRALERPGFYGDFTVKQKRAVNDF